VIARAEDEIPRENARDIFPYFFNFECRCVPRLSGKIVAEISAV